MKCAKAKFCQQLPHQPPQVQEQLRPQQQPHQPLPQSFQVLTPTQVQQDLSRQVICVQLPQKYLHSNVEFVLVYINRQF